MTTSMQTLEIVEPRYQKRFNPLASVMRSGSKAASHKLAKAIKRPTSYVLNSLLIRRVEFLIAEIPILGLPAALTARSFTELCTWQFAEFAFLFFLLFNFGDLINCLCDRDTDTGDKAYLAAAVNSLGTSTVHMHIAATALAALALSVHLSIASGRLILIPCTVIGLIVAAAYSAPPVRLKSRGVWQLLWYWGGLFVAPMIFTLLFFSSNIYPLTLLVIFGFATTQTGIVLLNTCEDYFDDKHHGTKTVAVALGLSATISLARKMGVYGSILLFGALGLSLGAITPFIALSFVSAISLLWFGLSQLDKKVSDLTEEEAIGLVKNAAILVPVALTVVAWMSLSIGLLSLYCAW